MGMDKVIERIDSRVAKFMFTKEMVNLHGIDCVSLKLII